MRRRWIFLAVTLFFAAAQPAGAAQVTPPGNSGVNQYTETLPGAGGDQPTGGANKGQNGTGNDGGASLSPAAERALRAQGQIGAEVAGLASTAPQHPQGQGARPAGKRHAGPVGSGGSGLGNVVDRLVGSDGSGGMGIALPIVLGSSLLGALLLIALRRRGGERPQ